MLDIISVILVIFIIVSCYYSAYRLCWVCNYRFSILYNKDFPSAERIRRLESLPSHGYMLFQFWKFDYSEYFNEENS
jgi:hypothetical protein